MSLRLVGVPANTKVECASSLTHACFDDGDSRIVEAELGLLDAILRYALGVRTRDDNHSDVELVDVGLLTMYLEV